MIPKVYKNELGYLDLILASIKITVKREYKEGMV